MKSTWKLLFIISIILTIGLIMVTCDSDSGTKDLFDGQWIGFDTETGNEAVISFSTDNDGGGVGVYTMSWQDSRIPTVNHLAGTYTYSGNTASLTDYNEFVATATISRNTMTLNFHFAELTFEFTR